MKNDENNKRCPYLREVVMVFCEAYPVKKMVPLERVTTPSHCFGTNFDGCALFAETAAQIHPPSNKKVSPPGSNGVRCPRIRP
jgi:hypothetical protein